MKTKPLENIRNKVSKNNIKHIALIFLDFLGNFKIKYVGVKELLQNTHVSWYNGMSIDGSTIQSYKNLKGSDWMLIKPDSDTFKIFPWLINEESQETAGLICDIVNFDYDSRAIVKKAEALANSNNFQTIFGPKLKFYIFDKENSQKISTNDSYYSLPKDKTFRFRNKLIDSFSKMGIDIEYYSASDINQINIDFVPKNLIKISDDVSFAKYVVENLALDENKDIYFKGLPSKGLKENFMFTHQSLWKDNKNAFFDPDDPLELSQIGRYYVGGILENIHTVRLFTNPFDYSNTKFFNTWSIERNQSIINVPMYFIEKKKKDRIGWSKRIFFKDIYSDCNPYLAFSAMLICGLEGIKRKIDPENYYLDNRKKSQFIKTPNRMNLADLNDKIKEVFGENFIEEYFKLIKKSRSDPR